MTMRIMVGDAGERLHELPDESVHCVVTSPPYYGLRDYGVAGQIGLEPSPAEYVETLVAVFREVRRVLRKDGTLWLNLGDTYNNNDKWGGGGVNAGKHTKSPDGSVPSWVAVRRKWAGGGLKPKDLFGIPWMVAFALRADGWWLRQDIIWSKPNPMPESVTDRCTKAHEYLFLLSKSERYYFDAGAIAEPASANSHGAIEGDPGAKARHTGNHSGPLGLVSATGTRNKRSVWTVTTQPYAEAHFATFPPALIEPCILAGTSEKGVCAKCGIPWSRVVDRTPRTDRPNSDGVRRVVVPGQVSQRGNRYSDTETMGWSPSCACNAATVPATVLDPFFGAGTTGIVADRLGRDCIGIELNPAYAEITRARLVDDAGMFANVEVAA